MKNLIRHAIEKFFATKIKTPFRHSLEEVKYDIEHLKSVYINVGMKLIDISYKEHISKYDSYKNGELWLNKVYMSYAVLYFVKDTKNEVS